MPFLRLFLPLLLSLIVAGCATPGLRPSEERQLAGRTYVILGASSGFGRGMAERLGSAGGQVVVAARRTELIEEVAAGIRARGGAAIAVTTDAADPEQVERLRAAALQRFGRIDVWVNIAGVGVNGAFWDAPVADYSRLVDVNLKGVIYGSHAALRQFIAQRRGVLINMGSVESVTSLAYHAAYAATKAGVLSLGRALNEELRLAGHGRSIKVATVLPWGVDTPFFQHTANYSGRADRMIWLDPPEKVVLALIRASLRPREEVPVGWKAGLAIAAHDLAPDLTERIAADIHHAELRKASPAPATSGSVHRPVPEGRGVDGGIRARMEAEDRARTAGKGD